MIDETALTRIIGEFHTSWGYAAGMEKLPGFLPGAKTFPPFERETPKGKVTIVDTYFGKRDSGGMAVVSLSDRPILLIQYHGGESPKVPDSEVSEINGFLKEALQKAKGARLPGVGREPVANHESGVYGYYGIGVGDIWNLRWVDLVYRTNASNYIRHILTFQRREVLNDVLLRGLGELSSEIIFYHVLTHQRLQ